MSEVVERCDNCGAEKFSWFGGSHYTTESPGVCQSQYPCEKRWASEHLLYRIPIIRQQIADENAALQR